MEDRERQFVNDLLEASLRNYAGAETRPGLEGRILAGVRLRQHKARHRMAWLSAIATAGLAAIVGFVALRGGHRPAAPERAIARYPAVQAAPTVATIGLPANLLVSRRVPQHIATTRVDWRPQQFPTPRPLSEQEKLLLAYVRTLRRSPAVPAPSVQMDSKADLTIPPLSITAIKIDPLDPSEDGDGK